MTLNSGGFPTGRPAADTTVQGQLALALLDGLYALMRAAVSRGVAHPSTAAMAADVAAAAAELQVPCGLQFLGASAYCNRLLLPVDIERVAQVLQVARALDAMGAQELMFDTAVQPETLLQLTQVLVRPTESAAVQVSGIHWRSLTGPVWGDGGKPIDRDVAARVWLARAAAAAERLDRSVDLPWPWATSAAILRRLEQVVALDPAVALRALELAPQPWPAGRRAVAVALRTMLTLAQVGASANTQRLAGHTALIAALHGFLTDPPQPFDLAAQAARARVDQEPGVDLAVSARHRLRVAALLQGLAQRAGTGGTWPGPLGALLVSWDLEARRGSGAGPERRTTMQALADAESDPFQLGGRPWLRALIAAMAGTPPGTVVVDAANQLGAVLDASGRSGGGRPMLVAQGQMVQGQAPLAPLLR